MNPNDSSLRCLVPVLFLSIVAFSPSWADSTDVFPLQRNLLCTYIFTENAVSWKTSYQDTGLVQYLVLDSFVVNDTTIAWSVSQRVHLTRHMQTSNPITDTTYLVDDSIDFTMTEFSVGRHELRSSSLLWGYGSWYSLSPVFRFSDSTHALSATPAGDCMRFAIPTNYDSLWFAADSGLYQRASSRCNDFDDYGSAYWRTGKLLDRIVVSVDEPPTLPAQLRLMPAYPNPFNSSTTIAYELPLRSDVLLTVSDVLGRHVARIVDGVQERGMYRQVFIGTELSSGVYIVRLQVAGTSCTSKLVLLR
jgi:hypothetical protein